MLVTAHPFLLETLFHNLLSNAIRHSPAAGQLALTLRERTLLVRNSGARPLEADQLFERFARASQEKVGSGLGLAIVKGIADRYGWSVSYRFTDQAHHFLVTF